MHQVKTIEKSGYQYCLFYEGYCNMDNKGLIYIKGLKYLKQFCLFGNYKTSKMIVAIDLNMKEIRGAKQSIY